MTKVYLGVNGPKWLENLLTEVHLGIRVQDDSGVP